MAALARAWSWMGLGGRNGAESGGRYQPDLITTLEDDHRDLLRHYGEITRMAVDGRFASIPAMLSAFKAKFDGHVYGETMHLYGFLEARFARQPDELRLIAGFRSEMDTIARNVTSFVRKYRMAGVRPSNGSEFLAELRAMGAMVLHRVRAEEKTLFLLYRA